MSIRLRLTLLYSTILAFTLIAFSSILFFTQAQATYNSIRTNLTRQLQGMVAAEQHLPQGLNRPPGGGAGGGPPFGGQAPAFNLPAGILPGRWTQVLNLDGTIVERTADLTETVLPLSKQGLAAVQNGASWYETATVQETPLLILSRKITRADGTQQILQLATPIAERQQSLNILRWFLIIGSGAAILVAFASGWLLAGTSLRPIHRLTQTAQAIGAERDFSRRVQHEGPTDEVGQLAITFNGMLSELEGAYRQLEEALDSQRRFVADASHELRTPLTTIRGNLELLRREPPIAAQDRTEIVGDTTEEVERMIRLVGQLLVLARADAGQRLALQPLPLKPLVEDVYRQAKILAPERTVLCGPIPDVQVMADRDALKQVLLILVDNAFVHTASGAQVELCTATCDGRVEISVIDTGAGIAPDALPHIFERFFRGDVARSGRSTGLGLAIAKELVEAQGGALSVESAQGSGTTFHIAIEEANPRETPSNAEGRRA